MISSVHNAIKTMDLFLALLTNFADLGPHIGAQELEKPELCTFLENTIASLTSRQGRAWQLSIKLYKHVGLAILIKVQLINRKFVIAAADPQNWDIDHATDPINQDLELDLASGIKLMS